MSRALIVFLLIILLVFGGLYYLSTVDTEQPLTRVEKPVSNDKLAK